MWPLSSHHCSLKSEPDDPTVQRPASLAVPQQRAGTQKDTETVPTTSVCVFGTQGPLGAITSGGTTSLQVLQVLVCLEFFVLLSFALCFYNL